jgi:very-short-patch-repair endonuclease
MRQPNLTRHRAAVLGDCTQALREFATASERKLWLELSGGKAAVSFRRQVPLAGRWIADFFAPSVRLVVEVDGSVHGRTRRADARRDEKLRRLGYHVLRVDAEVVLRNVPGAVALVRDVIERAQRLQVVDQRRIARA